MFSFSKYSVTYSNKYLLIFTISIFFSVYIYNYHVTHYVLNYRDSDSDTHVTLPYNFMQHIK